MKRMIAIGECMLEFRHCADGRYQRSFAGDVYNTCVYLKRAAGQDVDVSFLTAVGDDSLSEEMVATWQQEGINTALVNRVSGGTPGLYIISTDVSGERQFTYWRQNSIARQVIHCLSDDFISALPSVDLLYFSGISVAILDQPSRRRLCQIIEQLKAQGTLVAFDPNYRPALWQSSEEAKQWIEASYRLADIALPSLDDEIDLFGPTQPQAVIDRLLSWGVNEIAVKAGSLGVHGVHDGTPFTAAFAAPQQRVDTTAAGDSFDAIYLAQRLQCQPPPKAAQLAAQTAAFVVGYTGAITPRDSFSTFYGNLLSAHGAD